MSKGIIVALGICTLFVTGIKGEIIQRPLNVAMNVEGEVAINCSSNTGVVTWIYTTDCNAGVGITLTDSNCDITSSHTSHYRTEKPGGFVCNLVVFNALLTHGGCYVCADGIGHGRQFSAFLIVVDSNSNFTTNTTDLMPDEYTRISNSISYGGPSIQPSSLPPSFYWTSQSDPNRNITSYSESTTNSASSYIVVKAQKPDVPPFVCNLFLNAPVNVPQACANNTPTYRTNWITPTYKVSYPPENIDISEITMSCPDYGAVVLTCSASGYPKPTFEWLDLTNGGDQFYKGDTVTIDRGGTYQCVALNTIRDVTYSEKSLPVNVSDCFIYVVSEPDPPTYSVFISTVVIVTYFGLNLLFFAVFITCYFFEKCRNTLNDQFPWLRKMLPCINGEGCECSVWIVYFVLLSIFAAFVFFPTMLIMASCCRTQNKTSHVANSGDINLRQGVYDYENVAKPNTAPETSQYESLQRPNTQSTTPFYEELSHGHHDVLEREC